MAKISFSLPDPVVHLLLDVCRELGVDAGNHNLCVKTILINCLRKTLAGVLGP